MSSLVINDSELMYRETPWDERVFELETIEILKIDYKNDEDVLKLLTQLESEISKEGLVYFRSDSRDIALKKIMLSNNYYVTECALKLQHRKVKKCNFGEVYSNSLELSNIVNDGYIDEIKVIATTAFNFSRFHEDPFLDLNKSNKRYEFWIDDLIKQKKSILLYVKNDEVISFMFYELSKNKKVNLILGGSKNNYGIITPLFLSSILTYMKYSEVKVIDVTVSASNIQVLNMYMNLGFEVKLSMFDYHKLVKKACKHERKK